MWIRWHIREYLTDSGLLGFGCDLRVLVWWTFKEGSNSESDQKCRSLTNKIPNVFILSIATLIFFFKSHTIIFNEGNVICTNDLYSIYCVHPRVISVSLPLCEWESLSLARPFGAIRKWRSVCWMEMKNTGNHPFHLKISGFRSRQAAWSIGGIRGGMDRVAACRKWRIKSFYECF